MLYFFDTINLKCFVSEEKFSVNVILIIKSSKIETDKDGLILNKVVLK